MFCESRPLSPQTWRSYDAIAREWEGMFRKEVWMLKMEREVFGFLSELSETQPGRKNLLHKFPPPSTTVRNKMKSDAWYGKYFCICVAFIG